MIESFDKARRRFLKMGLVALACSAATPALAAMPRIQGSRSLAFHNLHTDERLRVTYWRDGKYDRAAWEKVNHVLRDFRTGDVHPMDIRLMDLLFDLQGKLENDNPVEIISGYRSPHTNLMLASLS